MSNDITQVSIKVNPKAYAKFIAAVVATLGVLATLVVDGGLSVGDIVAVVISGAGAFGVKQIPNEVIKGL